MATASFYRVAPALLAGAVRGPHSRDGPRNRVQLGRILAAAGSLYTGDLVAHYGGWDGMGATLAWVYAVGMVLILFAPETKGKPLPV